MPKQPISGDEPAIGGHRKSEDVQLGGDSAVVHIVNSLTHSDPTVRKRAAFMLAARGDDRAYDALIHLLEDADPSLHPAIVRALGKLGERRAVPVLLERVQDREERQAVRIAAADALGAIADPDAVEPLIELQEERTPRVLREAILRALTRIPDRRSLVVLLNTVSSYVFGDNPSITSDVLNYIRSMYADDLRRELVTLAAEGSNGARIALYHRRDLEAAPLLIGLIQQAIDQKEQLINSWIPMALGATGSPDAVEPLIAMLQALDFSENGPAGRAIIAALGLLRDPRVVEVLIPFLATDSYWPTADALGTIGDPRGVDPLITQLKLAHQTKDRDREQAMLYGLGKLGDPHAFAAVEVFARSRHSEVCRRAVEALGRINAPQAVAPLLLALRHQDEDVQKEAVRALGAYYSVDYRVRHALRALLDERNRIHEMHAAYIMAEHGEAHLRIIEILAARIVVGSDAARRANRLLRKIGTSEALAALRDARHQWQERRRSTIDYDELED